MLQLGISLSDTDVYDMMKTVNVDRNGKISYQGKSMADLLLVRSETCLYFAYFDDAFNRNSFFNFSAKCSSVDRLSPITELDIFFFFLLLLMMTMMMIISISNGPSA